MVDHVDNQLYNKLYEYDKSTRNLKSTANLEEVVQQVHNKIYNFSCSHLLGMAAATLLDSPDVSPIALMMFWVCSVCAYIAMSTSNLEQKEDEVHNLQKRVLMLEEGLDEVHAELSEVTNKLDTTEKQFSVVRLRPFSISAISLAASR